jgi:hypothetical protein
MQIEIQTVRCRKLAITTPGVTQFFVTVSFLEPDVAPKYNLHRQSNGAMNHAKISFTFSRTC